MTNSIFSLILCSLTALCAIDIDFVWVANPILAEGNTNYIPLNSRDGVRDREKTTTTQTKPKSQTMENRFCLPSVSFCFGKTYWEGTNLNRSAHPAVVSSNIHYTFHHCSRRGFWANVLLKPECVSDGVETLAKECKKTDWLIEKEKQRSTLEIQLSVNSPVCWLMSE